MTLNTEKIFNIVVSGRSNYTVQKFIGTGSLLTKGFCAENKPEFFYKYLLLIPRSPYSDTFYSTNINEMGIESTILDELQCCTLRGFNINTTKSLRCKIR